MSQDHLRSLLETLNSKLRETFGLVLGTVIAGPLLTVNLDAGRGKILQPSTLVRSPAVGERVWLLRMGVFSLILGVAGGRPIVLPTYRGAWAAQPWEWNGSHPVYYATQVFQLPHAVPSGYSLIVDVGSSSGFSFVDVGSRSGTTVNVRAAQLGNSSSTALSQVLWAMIPGHPAPG